MFCVCVSAADVVELINTQVEAAVEALLGSSSSKRCLIHQPCIQKLLIGVLIIEECYCLILR